eukprot:scaffold28009_cov55-Phaeocystis_antarctica.AAC.6
MAVAQRLPLPLHRLLAQRPRLLQLAHVLQQIAHAADRVQRVPVAVAERLPPRLHRLLEQRLRLLILARQVRQQPAQVVDRAQRSWVAGRHPPLCRRQQRQCRPRVPGQVLVQQADDQLVALRKSHVAVELVEDGFRFFGAAALGVAHVHLAHASFDRAEVLDERRFERGLLRRGHHHIELRAARLRVVDLLDAIGPLEGLRIVPRLHQQHRVPDGADAVAEERQLLLDIGLPDHVVAHPEESVLRPQPLLLEELVEGVEQRFDRRVEEPAHEYVGLAHVRRPLLVKPLAHGQPVHRFQEGEEVLVDVAVLRVVRGVLGVVTVDLLHCVARQL